MIDFRILSPSDRYSEILCGLIMVLAITGTVWLGTHSTKAVISAGIGACAAWGIVDGVIYVYGSILERGRIALAIQETFKCADEGCSLSAIKEELEDTIVDTLSEQERDDVARHIFMYLKPVGNRTKANKDDILGGIATGMLVFVSGIPLLLPFMFLDDIWALRLSRVIGFVMLYTVGHRWGGYIGISRLWTGVTMLSIGITITGVVVALGGE